VVAQHEGAEQITMTFMLQTVVAVGQIMLSFYGFWLVWRVLLPELPGPSNPEQRIPPYARYFIDPFVQPLASHLHVHPRVLSGLLLILVAAGHVGLDRLAASV
jgi:hypothetical protein